MASFQQDPPETKASPTKLKQKLIFYQRKKTWKASRVLQAQPEKNLPTRLTPSALSLTQAQCKAPSPRASRPFTAALASNNRLAASLLRKTLAKPSTVICAGIWAFQKRPRPGCETEAIRDDCVGNQLNFKGFFSDAIANFPREKASHKAFREIKTNFLLLLLWITYIPSCNQSTTTFHQGAMILDCLVASLGSAFISSSAETSKGSPFIAAKHKGDQPPSSYLMQKHLRMIFGIWAPTKKWLESKTRRLLIRNTCASDHPILKSNTMSSLNRLIYQGARKHSGSHSGA